MHVSLRWRLIVAAAAALLGIVYMLPSLPGMSESPIGAVLPEDKVSLGLDLKGGIHLTLEVEVAKAMENSLAQVGRDIRSMAREEGITVLKPRVNAKSKQPSLRFTLIKGEEREALDKLLEESFSGLVVKEAESKEGRVLYTLVYDKNYAKNLTQLTVDQAVKTIRNRIDQFGVAEPDIRKQQNGRIQVQLPGMSDPERAIALIGQTAHLEFKIVDDAADPEAPMVADREVLPMMRTLPNGQEVESKIVVFRDAAMTGEHITDARIAMDQFGQPYVSLTFSSRGARDFERVTGENVKKRMAIVLDGKVYSAPTIQDRISGGRASITGSFSDAQARDLAVVLRAGALPAPIKVLEQRAVGPSLGQESIDKGVNSAIIGMALVMVFMAVYYGLSGLIADIVLCLNLVLIMAGLAAFGATLTLPGIAGIILTIGMAVDANVIIFERIREELRRGLTPRGAIEEGYGRATLTILDANVTTIIAAVILYEFGTGPIRGFAVTLSLGILASMFTAIFVSRVLFDLYTASRPKLEKLSV